MPGACRVRTICAREEQLVVMMKGWLVEQASRALLQHSTLVLHQEPGYLASDPRLRHHQANRVHTQNIRPLWPRHLHVKDRHLDRYALPLTLSAIPRTRLDDLQSHPQRVKQELCLVLPDDAQIHTA